MNVKIDGKKVECSIFNIICKNHLHANYTSEEVEIVLSSKHWQFKELGGHEFLIEIDEPEHKYKFEGALFSHEELYDGSLKYCFCVVDTRNAVGFGFVPLNETLQ